MRLLDAEALIYDNVAELVNFPDESTAPRYAILSHTWDHEEVLFEEIGLGPHHEIQHPISSTREQRRRRVVESSSSPDQREFVNMSEDTVDDTTGHTKAGWKKIFNACMETLRAGLMYIWIDTCCIDKSSSAELSEAINSMFRWYESASVCFVYLSDCQWKSTMQYPTRARDQSPMLDNAISGCIRGSRWFTRGWTLQELIAPSSLYFLDRNWDFIADRAHVSDVLKSITGIPQDLLRPRYMWRPRWWQTRFKAAIGAKEETGSMKPAPQRQEESVGRDHPFTYSVAQRMHWASKRQTTRKEDEAYCLLGLFGINMPLLYGEGSRAFKRLQQEIIRTSTDQSIFAWDVPNMSVWNYSPSTYLDAADTSLLAPSPRYFAARSSDIVPDNVARSNASSKYQLTNEGIEINLQLDTYRMTYGYHTFIAALSCVVQSSRTRVGVWLNLERQRTRGDQELGRNSRLRAFFVSMPGRWGHRRRLIELPYFDAHKRTFNDQLTLIEGPTRFHMVIKELEPPTVEISVVLSRNMSDWSSFESFPLAPCHFRTLNCERMRLPLRNAFGALAFKRRHTRHGFIFVIGFTTTTRRPPPRVPTSRNKKQKEWNYWILPLFNVEEIPWVSGCHQEYLQAICKRASAFDSLDYFENSSRRRDSSKTLYPTSTARISAKIEKPYINGQHVITLDAESVDNFKSLNIPMLPWPRQNYFNLMEEYYIPRSSSTAERV